MEEDELVKWYEDDPFFYLECPWCGIGFCINSMCKQHPHFPHLYGRLSKQETLKIHCPLCTKEMALVPGVTTVVWVREASEDERDWAVKE